MKILRLQLLQYLFLLFFSMQVYFGFYFLCFFLLIFLFYFFYHHKTQDKLLYFQEHLQNMSSYLKKQEHWLDHWFSIDIYNLNHIPCILEKNRKQKGKNQTSKPMNQIKTSKWLNFFRITFVHHILHQHQSIHFRINLDDLWVDWWFDFVEQ